VICILTGPVHSGKTSLLLRVAADLEARGVVLGGYLSPAVREGGMPAGYDLFDLQAKRTVPFIRREGEEGWQRSGDHYFLPQGLAAAKDIIGRSGGADLLVVDEVGPLEMKGQGLWPVLAPVLARGHRRCLLVAREKVAAEIAVRLKDLDVKVFNAGHGGVQSLIVDLLSAPLGGV